MLSAADYEKLAQAKASAEELAKALKLLVSSEDPLLSVLAQQELEAAVKIEGAISYWHAVTGESEGCIMKRNRLGDSLPCGVCTLRLTRAAVELGFAAVN